MRKVWRRQTANNSKNEEILKGNRNVAELWWYAFNLIDKTSFHSLELGGNQLNPFDYTLTIPHKSNLESYDESKAILSLLGRGNNIDFENDTNKKLATIYHELFHVFQSTATKRVFNYFYLIDDIQKTRTQLLEYLGYCNFYTWAEEAEKDMGKTIFHSVEEYYSLTEEVKNFTHLSHLCRQAKNIKEYSDLSRRNIEEVIDFFKFAKDINLHIFHLIEGSAQIFGWCCAGYNIEEKLKFSKKVKQGKNIVQSDTYEKAYELFREHGGKTPLLFIIISLFSLSSYNSIDIFMICLRKIKIWEDDLKSFLHEEEITSDKFRLLIVQLIEQIENSLRGNFYNFNAKSIHDKEDANSLFLKSINRIRKVAPKSNKLEFLSNLVCDKNVVSTLIESFESHVKEFKDDLRKNEVMRDFEQFLRRADGTEIYLKCCKEHGEDIIYDFPYPWYECSNKDSFNQILLNELKVSMPNRFKE